MEKSNMTNQILRAIRILKKDENPSDEVKECLSILEGSLESKVNTTLLDMMAIADVFGYENLLARLGNLTALLEGMNEHKEK